MHSITRVAETNFASTLIAPRSRFAMKSWRYNSNIMSAQMAGREPCVRGLSQSAFALRPSSAPERIYGHVAAKVSAASQQLLFFTGYATDAYRKEASTKVDV